MIKFSVVYVVWLLKFIEGYKNIKDIGICVKSYSKIIFNFFVRWIRMFVLNKIINNIILDFSYFGNFVLVKVFRF